MTEASPRKGNGARTTLLRLSGDRVLGGVDLDPAKPKGKAVRSGGAKQAVAKRASSATSSKTEVNGKRPAARRKPDTSLAAGSAQAHFKDYSRRLSAALLGFDWTPVEVLATDLHGCWLSGRQVFLCGNGGSAGNANHLANDFTFSLSRRKGSGIRVHALSANPAVVTCLANDVGYDNAFAYQLAVQARRGDVLVVLSGSGNSGNILRALEEARRLGMTSYAIVGFDGGKAKTMADVAIHFDVQDMQIAEDTQTVIGHMIVQWLYERRDEIPAR